MSNLFDFNDFEGVPEELQRRLSHGGRVNPNIAIYADIIKAGNAAGFAALSMAMIETVAVKMGLPSISQQAIRNALTGAVKAGLIVKVTRQTYGVVGTAVEADASDEVETPPVADAPVDETDPLA